MLGIYRCGMTYLQVDNHFSIKQAVDELMAKHPVAKEDEVSAQLTCYVYNLRSSV